MKVAMVVLLLSCALAWPAPTDHAEVPAKVEKEAAAPPTVCFQPLGKYDRNLLGKSVSGVKYLYGFPVRVLPR
jgi:hypothetical protein